MDNNLPDQLPEQVNDLQIQLTHMQNDIDSLNSVITKQDKALLEMQRQLQLVYAQINDSRQSAHQGDFNPSNELPPHY